MPSMEIHANSRLNLARNKSCTNANNISTRTLVHYSSSGFTWDGDCWPWRSCYLQLLCTRQSLYYIPVAEGWKRFDKWNRNLIISNVSAMNGGNYTCVVSIAVSSDSATAVLHVEPIIVTQPTVQKCMHMKLTLWSYLAQAQSQDKPLQVENHW